MYHETLYSPVATTPTPSPTFPAAAPASALRVQALAEAREEAWRRWWRLFSAPGLRRGDGARWRAMLRARVAYQDATIAWAEAARYAAAAA